MVENLAGVSFHQLSHHQFARPVDLGLQLVTPAVTILAARVAFLVRLTPAAVCQLLVYGQELVGLFYDLEEGSAEQVRMGKRESSGREGARVNLYFRMVKTETARY